MNTVTCMMLGAIKPVLDAVVNRQNNNEPWIPINNMLSASYNDMLAEIRYKGCNAAVCSFNRDNIRKAQDQKD